MGDARRGVRVQVRLRPLAVGDARKGGRTPNDSATSIGQPYIEREGLGFRVRVRVRVRVTSIGQPYI